MVNTAIKRGLVLLVAFLCMLNASAATINVKTDRSQVSLNESFQLIFEAEGDVDEDPDFSPLEQDFQVLSTVQSSNFSVLNGRISSSKRWTLTVMANSPGVKSVPAIPFGNDSSPVIQVEVKAVDTGASSGQQQDDIYLEATATPEDPYVQAQVIYTLKLFRSVAIAKASLADPEISVGNAVLERLDDDKSYETTINGKDYQVIERNYAVYPQSSGEVTIAPINFMGQISRSRFGLDPFGAPPRTVVRRSQAVTINVRSTPASFTGDHWLPAENLNIAEEWSGDPLTLRVGEPITRTLVLTAKGLISSQLPELPAWDLPDLKFYPDRPQLEDEKQDTGITSIRREKAAIIPNQSGTYVLPEVSVPWWNTRTDSLDYAVVPERTIEVMPASGVAANPSKISGLTQDLPQIPQLPGEHSITSEDVPASPGEASANVWKWTTLLLVLVWLTTLILWRQKSGRGMPSGSAGPANASRAGLATLQKEVLAACLANDPVRTKQGLMAWARCIWQDAPPLGLADLARRTGPQMAEELNKLNEVLYRPGSEAWQGKELQALFPVEAKRIAAQTSQPDTVPGKLEPLFRIS